jgi:hypothetical protein
MLRFPERRLTCFLGQVASYFDSSSLVLNETHRGSFHLSVLSREISHTGPEVIDTQQDGPHVNMHNSLLELHGPIAGYFQKN